MGLFGGSKRTTNTKVENFTYNTSVGIEGDAPAALGDASTVLANIAGPAVTGSGNTLSIIDGETVGRGVELVTRVAELERDNIAAVLGANQSAVDAGLNFGRQAFEFGYAALDQNAGIYQDAFAFADGVFSDSLEAVQTTLERATATAAAISEQAAASVADSNRGDAARVESLAVKAFLALALLALLPLLKRG